jgi:CRP/FNR family transcriptional regulator, cyclic AMP receptor protein
MFLDLQSRLAKALLRLVDADIGDMRERKISITQKDLGYIIGVSRESTNKQLRLWEDKKWVRLERNAVVILAIDPLAKLPKLFEVLDGLISKMAGRSIGWARTTG